MVIERHFEVYNGHPGVGHLGDDHRPSVERLWDIANTIRLVDLAAPPLFGIATDDSHSYHGKPQGVAARPRLGDGPQHAPDAGIYRAGDQGRRLLRQQRRHAGRRKLRRGARKCSRSTSSRMATRRITTQFVGTLRGTPSAGEATLDKDGKPLVKDGKPLRVSRTYSKEIGKVLATATGLKVRATS